MIAAKIGEESRFRSLQIGVSQESFGESIQRNMSWAGYERALPPEMIPHKLFDRLFGAREEGWVNRKRSILDAVRDDAAALKKKLADGRSGARRRASVRQSATWSARSPVCRRSIARVDAAGFRRRHAGLAADRQAAERSAGPCAGDAADARRLVHADEVPGALAFPVARLHARPGITTTRMPTVRRLVPTGSTDSASCATSAAGTWKSSRTCSAN